MRGNKEQRYEVYTVIADDEEGTVLYVGEGKENRHLHIISGISHIPLANLCKNSGDLLHINRKFVNSKEEAVKEEARLIALLKPAWNSEFSSNLCNIRKQLRAVAISMLLGREAIGSNMLKASAIFYAVAETIDNNGLCRLTHTDIYYAALKMVRQHRKIAPIAESVVNGVLFRDNNELYRYLNKIKYSKGLKIDKYNIRYYVTDVETYKQKRLYIAVKFDLDKLLKIDLKDHQ